MFHSKPPCEVSACFFRPFLKILLRKFGGVNEKSYICGTTFKHNQYP